MGEKQPAKKERVRAPKGTAGKILGTVFSCCPVSAPVYVVWSVAAAAASFFLLTALERTANAVAALSDGGSFGAVWAAAGVYALCMLLKTEWVLSGLFRNRFCYRLNVRFAPRIMEKYARLEYLCYEDKEMADVMFRTTDNPIVLPVDAFFNFTRAATSVLSVLSGAAYFLTVSVWLALAYGLLVLAAMILDVLSAREVIRAQWEQSEDNRRMEDISALMQDKNALFELHVTGGASYLTDKFRRLGRRDAKRMFAAARRGFRYNLAGMALLAAWAAATAVLLVRLFSAGRVDVGVIVTVIVSFPMLLDTAWRIAAGFKRGYEGYVAAGYLYRLLAFPERKDGGLPVTGAPDVVFEDVWFRYPGTETDVLKGVSFRLAPGRSVSLVGENGSGKSTIVKLLLRLYRPTKGRITLNGTDISQYAEDAYFRTVGAVFQDYMRYELPLDENIALARGADLSRVAASPFYAEAVAAAGSETAFLGRRLPGGRDLSGGEWQKVAILRLMYRAPALMLLDEPTASLDALAENEVYEAVRRFGKGRSALFISHRLALSVIADEILVLSDGVIAERGTHDELKRKEGLYAALYETQAAWYRPRG